MLLDVLIKLLRAFHPFDPITVHGFLTCDYKSLRSLIALTIYIGHIRGGQQDLDVH